MTQNLSFPGVGSGSVWLQHGPHPALASELGIALSSAIVKEPPWQRVRGVVSGGRMCAQVGSGRAGRVCSLVEQQVQAWPGGQRGTDWSLMVGGPAIGGWDKDLYFPHWNGRL